MSICVIITCHMEGNILINTLKCAASEIASARNAGIEAECIIVCDKADAATMDVVKHYAGNNWKVIKTDLGDPGLARNVAINETKAEFVALLDGDDIWGAGWLVSAFAARGSKLVLHSKYNVYFPINPHVFVHTDPNDLDYDPKSIYFTNYWTALCFAARQTFIDVPYDPTILSDGFGHEDWHWNIKIIEKGYAHKVVEGTIHFIRQKKLNSRVAAYRMSLVRPIAWRS